MPYMDVTRMGQVNAKTIRGMLSAITKVDVPTGRMVYDTPTNVYNRMLAYIMGSDTVTNIPAKQRERATEILKSVLQKNLELLERLKPVNVKFLEQCNKYYNTPVTQGKIPKNFVLKNMVSNAIEEHMKKSKMDMKLFSVMLDFVHIFLPWGKARYKVLKNPVPQRPGTDPYKYIMRNYCPKNIIVKYVDTFYDIIQKAKCDARV